LEHTKFDLDYQYDHLYVPITVVFYTCYYLIFFSALL